MKFFAGRHPLKSILKNSGAKRKLTRSNLSLRFKDQCKTSHPFLSFFSRDARFLKIWKSIAYLSFTYEIWAFPFRFAFCDPSINSFLYTMDITSDSILSLNVIIEMVEQLDNSLKQNNDPSLDRALILDFFRGTFRAFFLENILCFVPYYAVTIPISKAIEQQDDSKIDIRITTGHWVWWLSTIPRCFIRSYKLFKLHNAAAIDISSNIHTEDGKNIAILIILSAHCIGCLYFFLSRLRGLDTRSWVFSIEQTLNVYHRFDSQLWEQYLLALFKGFSAISGIEFTSYLANNLEEQILGIIMILVQMYISALILGTIIHFLALRDPLAEQFAEKVRDLRAYIHLNQLPPELEAKLIKGLEFQHSKMVLDNADAEMELSQSLQLKVVQSKYGSLLQRGRAKGQLFFECNERFLNEMLIDFNVLYLMAGQDIVKKGDISQELIVLVDGAADIVNDNGESTSIISSSSPDAFPCVGEIAFFLGIMQPFTVRARLQSDVRVVALSRESSEALFKKFPDQLEIVSRNILRWYGLDLDGSPLAGAGASDEDVHSAVRESLRSSIIRRREEAFANVILATKASELDVVKRLAFGGIELMKDYDSRTLLSHAAESGAYKVGEFLLDLRADINVHNRWGQTPMDEALIARQQTTVQLLFQNRGVMGVEAMSATLIQAASAGHLETSPDAEQMERIMRQSHIDPNIGDYDRRTALHLACANGYVKTAEMLINLSADVNVSDRWSGTPLADAVTGGHIAMATLLRSKGARMSSEVGTTKFFDAAAKGNVVALRLLHSCDVVDLECMDYDRRNALHIAAAEGRLLAVSYLMSNSFSPHFQDRWGATAMDDALKGKTLYHMYCAKLIQSMGGRISMLKGTEEGEQALEALSKVHIDDVRKRLMYLNRAGYNQIVPMQGSEVETAQSFANCLVHLPLVQTMIERLRGTAKACVSATAELQDLAVKMDAHVRPVCRLLDLHPILLHKKAGPLPVGNLGTDSFVLSRATGLEAQLALLQKTKGTRSSFNEYTGSRKYLIRKLSTIILLALEDGNIDAQEQMQIDLAWEELTNAGVNQLLKGMDYLDSDDEAELYADVDTFSKEREFCEAHGIERCMYKVHKFQNSTLKIADMEAMYSKLCTIFSKCPPGGAESSKHENDAYGDELNIGVSELVRFFDLIGEETMQHKPRFEIENMIEQARKYVSKGDEFLSRNSNSPQKVPLKDAETKVSLRILVAGSHDFRSALLGLEVDEPFGLVMQKSKLSKIIEEPLLRDLCSAGAVRLAGKGELLFDSERNTKMNTWFVVISGSLCLTLSWVTEKEDCESKSLGNGCFFGGSAELSGRMILPCTIRCTSGCQIVELPLHALKALKESYPLLARNLAAEMEESPSRIVEFDLDAAAISNLKLERATEKSQTTASVQFLFANEFKVHNALEPSNDTEAIDDTANPAKSQLSEASTFFRYSGNAAIGPLKGKAAEGPNSFLSKSEAAALSPQITMLDLYVIKSGFQCIFDVWSAFSCGDPIISKKTFYALQEELGEVGNGVFGKLFLTEVGRELESIHCADRFYDMDAGEFWGRWMKLLLDTSRRSDEDLDTGLHMAHEAHGRAVTELCSGMTLAIFSQSCCCILGSYIESFKIMLSDCRDMATSVVSVPPFSLRKRYLDKKFVQSGRYEQAYTFTVGSLGDPLDEDDIPIYIKNLFPQYADQVSRYHSDEFKMIFSKNGEASTKVTWADIKKVLRPILSSEMQPLFIGSTFNPRSRYMTWFNSFQRLLAVYHFISTPLLLCFADDDARMNDNLTTLMFIPADLMTFICVLIRLNTARSVRHNEWITGRWEIAMGLGNIGIIPGLPLDWIAHALGDSYETCLWIRMNKLLLAFRAFGQDAALSSQHSVLQSVVYQIGASLAVLHMCSCCWYFMAKKYPLSNQNAPYVWFKPYYPEDDPRFRPNLATDRNGFEYSGLSCDKIQAADCSLGDSRYYFGMSAHDGLMAKYMLSIYFASTRIANQSLYGMIVPQNFLEVGFCICNMILNLTLFRWVIGDLSTLVMESDQGKFAARTKSMKIFSFISKNRFSTDLANEIRSFCENANDHASSARCARVLRFLPRFLQDEVARHVCRDLLDRIELLAGCSDHFKDLLSSAVSTKAFSPEEYLFRIGEVGNDLYIVKAGSIETLAEASNTLTGEKVEATFGPGSAVEQVSFFFQLQLVVSARARQGGAACLRVGRESFLQILKCFPVDEELVTQNALRTVAFSRTGTSTVSFQSERDGEKTALTSKSHLSDVSAGRHGKKNRNSILQIEQNRRNMKMLIMFSAVKAGDLPTVQWCLKGGLVSINSSDSNSRSLLHIAAGNGNAEITEFLLKASADVSLKDRQGNTPLNDAVLACHDDIAAMIREHAPGTVLSLDGFQAGTKLCEAAAAGDLSQVQRLIKNGVSVNAHDYDGRTGLHLAACEGRAEIVTYLLQARAEPGAQDRFGGNALDDAIRHGHASIKQLVYEAGARVSGMDNTLKACAASAAGDPKAIDLTKSLVDNGLDPKMGNYDGRTPLHLAACSGKLGLLEYFISKIQAASGGSGSGGGSGGGHAPASGPAAEGTDGSQSAETSDVHADSANSDENVEGNGVCIVSRLPEGDFLGDSHFNVVDRHGCTPLDDAHRHEHAAAIVVLEKAGALRRGDPRLEASVSARRQRDKERLRLSQREAAQAYLSTSIESKAWEHCDGTVLPALHTFLHQLAESKREVEELARKVLPAVRAIIERYIRNVLPREMTIVRAKLARLSSFRREGSSASSVPSVHHDSAAPPRRPGDRMETVGGGRRAADPGRGDREWEQHASVTPEYAAGAWRGGAVDAGHPFPGRLQLEEDITELIRRIGVFLSRDCVTARDVLQIDFMKCGALHLASKGLASELALLSAQLRRSAGLLKLVRRVLKDVSTLCLSYHKEPHESTRFRPQHLEHDGTEGTVAIQFSDRRDGRPFVAWDDDSDVGSQSITTPRRENAF